MNVIVNKGINSTAEAKEAGKNLADVQIKQSQEEELNTIDAIKKVDQAYLQGESEEQRQLAAILALPEDKFALLAPIFLQEFRANLHGTNEKLISAQLMNATGITLENIEESLNKVFEVIDNSTEGNFSQQKKDFLKQIIGTSYNILAETEGIAKKKIVIPIEYCRPDAKMPTYAHLTDAGMDIYLTEDVTIRPGETVLIPTGIKVALPMGYELQVRPKSGRSLKSKLRIANTPGTIDAGYRDEIGIICDNIDPVIRSADIDEDGRLYNILWGNNIMLSKGEKIAQLVLSEVPKAVFYEVESVSEIANDGRNGGFGSTGDK